MAADYYPNNDTDIRIGEPVTWYLGVTDNMGTAQLVGYVSGWATRQKAA